MTNEAITRRDLRDAHVTVVGVGGLGCPAATGLAAAGVGRLTLIDGDRVERSNLPRQLLHADVDIGRAKVDSAADTLRRLYPPTKIETVDHDVTEGNAHALLCQSDFVIDATDGSATKLLINDTAVRAGQPYCHAGVVGFRGQVMTVQPGRGPCLRCVFPDLEVEDDEATCRQAGIVAPVAGLVGAIQASEALAYLSGQARSAGRLATYDCLSDRWLEINCGGVPACTLCALLTQRFSREGEDTSWVT